MRDEVITDLDRQIQEALDVDPSPDFKARVRIRLAEEPRRYRVGIGWLLSGVTGLTVVTVLAVFVSSRNDVRPRPADVVAPVAAGNAAVVAAVSPPAIPKPTAERVRRVTRRNATQTVLVPPSEREAFRRFLQAVTENPLPYSFSVDRREDAPLSVPDITIEPILIEPIDAAGE
jgi:4-amino-4-deoxy-L-arabinose transferase-like glycosyltransferase